MSPVKSEEESLIVDIESKKASGELSYAKLKTDERVLARITDGIYRQPSSALRELISNAYDADANNVIINTDAPRFAQITIRDDGNGMDIATLARLINHIGGSSKRRREGVDFHTTSDNPNLSPQGRRLIGKIGIGLFSVAQLTRHFQIVTKVAGNNFRLVAEVILNNYNEDNLSTSEEGDTLESGDVVIRSVPADDLESHGTEIILMDLRPQTIDLLRSRDIWDAVNRSNVDEHGIMVAQKAPTFHIGRLHKESGDYDLLPRLPWSREDPSDTRFLKIFQGIVDEIGVSVSDPKLEQSFDNYFNVIWNLSLAAPVDYLEDHPFDLNSDSEPNVYEIKPYVPGQATLLDLKFGETIRKRLKLKCPERGQANHAFRVLVDDIELRRPIRFSDFPASKHAIKTPLLFVGKAHPDLSGIPEEERGGDLEFEAYFLWSPKVVPRENSGLLIRIGDASGTLFDETFAKYQVSENTRLRQITAEIFITKGLDAALNIDRESFNGSHPHYQYIAKWTHRALRQIVNTLKHLADQISQETKTKDSVAKAAALEDVVADAVQKASVDAPVGPAVVEIATDDQNQLAAARKLGKLALNSKKVFAEAKFKKGKKAERENDIFRKQIMAVAQILEAYGLMSGLSYEQQEELLQSIVAIFSIERK